MLDQVRSPVRVCVAGSTGWTGRAVAQAVAAADDLELVASVSRSDPESFSSVPEALETVGVDVLVDYTHAAVVRANALAAIEQGVSVVVGSSGLTAADFADIDALARSAGVGVIAAGNFSLTAALLLRFATEAARHVGVVGGHRLRERRQAGRPQRHLPGAGRATSRRTVGGGRGSTRPGARDEEARGATVAGTQVHSLRLPSFSVSTEIVFAAADERLSCATTPEAAPRPTWPERSSPFGLCGSGSGLTRGLDQLLA